MNQDSKNKIAMKLVKKHLKIPIKEINLAYTLLEIVTESRIKLSSSELTAIEKKILQEVRDFKK